MNANVTKNIVSWIAIFGGLSSIAGIIIALCTDKNKAIIALFSIIIFLLIVLFAVFYTVKQVVRKEQDKDFLKLADFVSYKFHDKTHIDYDVYRLIQSKRPFLTEVRWNFKWSGKSTPKIDSSLQKCDGKIYKGVDDGFDHVILRFDKTLSYNESEVLHFHAEMDDTDNSSLPVVGIKIEEPVKVIKFQVILLYKGADFDENAELQSAPIHDSGYGIKYQIEETVAFNKQSKSYECFVPSPKVGYFYRLEWKK
jgi:hypothetical protein